MVQLGDFLPNKLKDEVTDRRLVVGSVFKMFVRDTIPPKEKFIIVVGMAEPLDKIATVFINTELNPTAFSSKEIKRLQHRLQAIRCTYLRYDSFADCAIMSERSLSDIRKKVNEDMNLYKGELPTDDLQVITQLLQSATTISTRLLKRYGLI